MMNKKTSVGIFSLLFSFLGMSVLNAQETLTLEKAISIGLENNYAIRLAKGDVEISSLDNQLSNAGFFPTVQADGTYNERKENTELSFADGSTVDRSNAFSSNLNAGVEANWFVFDGTKMFVTKEKLNELENIAQENLAVNINNVVAEIINAYTVLIAEQQTLKLYKSQLEVSELRLQLSRTKFDIGSSSELENLQAEVDANADRTALLDQEVVVKEAKIRLNRLMAREVDTDFSIQDSIVIQQNFDKEQLVNLMDKNPNLSLIERQKNVAVLERRENFADRLPKISLNGRYNYNQAESEAGFVRSNRTDGLVYGATIAIPIYNGNERNRVEQQSKIRIEQSRLNYEQEYALIKEQLVLNYERHTAYLNRLSLEKKNVELARKNLNFALENYRLGGTSSLELREVQFSTLAAQERLIALKYTIKMAETELLRLTNQLIQGK